MDEPAVSLLALRFTDASFARELVWKKDEDVPVAQVATQDEFDGFLAQVHAHGSVVSALLRAEAVGPAWLCGGMTSSRGPQLQISTNGVHDDAGTGVVFSRRLPIQVGLAQGCTPLGPIHRVTAVIGSVVLTIDGRAALDVLEEETAVLDISEPRELGRRVAVGVTLPHRDRHDYLVRNLTGVGGADRAIAVGHQFRLGDTFQFVVRNADSAREEMRGMLEELAQRMPSPRAGLYVSCVARGGGLFGEPDVEPNMIREMFGDIPLAGFFSGGEIYHRNLYGQSGVLTLFGE
jgi:small ligand-binding sensory domain FIST